MDPPRKETEPESLTEAQRQLLRLYGKLPNKRDLLGPQLETRRYFDSGDYALSRVDEASDIGKVRTGKQHPIRGSISHPESSVPSSSNVEQKANQTPHDAKDMHASIEESHLGTQECK